jgi:hypothetical protein
MPNLFMALFWLVLAGLLLAWHAAHPENAALRIGGSGPSLGWVALVLALYNFVRWWSQRAYARQRRLLEELRSSRQPQRPRGTDAPDPAFDFSNEPPRADEGRT